MNFKFDATSGLVLTTDNQTICLTDKNNGQRIADCLNRSEVALKLRKQVEEIMAIHADPYDGVYNECDHFPCEWCQENVRIFAEME